MCRTGCLHWTDNLVKDLNQLCMLWHNKYWQMLTACRRVGVIENTLTFLLFTFVPRYNYIVCNIYCLSCPYQLKLRKFADMSFNILQEKFYFCPLVQVNVCRNLQKDFFDNSFNHPLTLIGMSSENKKNTHLKRHLGASFRRLNQLGRVSN